ncbi:hypothetical protein EJB05_20781, partial [Eragrostis curvula]
MTAAIWICAAVPSTQQVNAAAPGSFLQSLDAAKQSSSFPDEGPKGDPPRCQRWSPRNLDSRLHHHQPCSSLTAAKQRPLSITVNSLRLPHHYGGLGGMGAVV